MSHTCDQSELIFSSQIGTQKLATVFLSSLTSWGWGYGDVWSKKKDRDITITLQSQSTQFHITIAWAQPRPMCPRWEKLHNISSAQCQPGKWWTCVPGAVEPTKQVLRRLEKYLPLLAIVITPNTDRHTTPNWGVGKLFTRWIFCWGEC